MKSKEELGKLFESGLALAKNLLGIMVENRSEMGPTVMILVDNSEELRKLDPKPISAGANIADDHPKFLVLHPYTLVGPNQAPPGPDQFWARVKEISLSLGAYGTIAISEAYRAIVKSEKELDKVGSLKDLPNSEEIGMITVETEGRRDVYMGSISIDESGKRVLGPLELLENGNGRVSGRMFGAVSGNVMN